MDKLETKIPLFVQTNTPYYQKQFIEIQKGHFITLTWNFSAFLFGPIWWAYRNLRNFFWVFLILELLGAVYIARGFWGDPWGAERKTLSKSDH